MTPKEAIKQLDGANAMLFNRNMVAFNRAIITAISALQEKAEREDPKPLTIEELQQMHGEPVWVKPSFEDPTKGEWCVVYNPDGKHYFDALIPGIECSWHPSYEYGKTWLAYRHKPKEDHQ